MDNTLGNQELALAAKRTLAHITGSGEALKPLYLQPDRALFLAEKLGIVLKVYMAGKTLQREYAIAQKAESIGVPIPKIIGFEAGQPAVLAMKQIIGHPLSSRNKFAAKEAGRYLQRPLYRLLRHLAEIPWLLERGFKESAERDIIAVQDSLVAVSQTFGEKTPRERT